MNKIITFIKRLLNRVEIETVTVTRIDDRVYKELEKSFPIVGGSNMDAVSTAYQLGAQAVLAKLRKEIVV